MRWAPPLSSDCTALCKVWRFLTYQFVHVNMEHIVFNTLMQLVVGLPLEMSQPGYAGTLKWVPAMSFIIMSMAALRLR